MKKVLIFRGGWDGHDPVKTSDRVAQALIQRGYEVDLFDSDECLIDDKLSEKYQLIIPVWTMGTIQREALNSLLKAVKDDGVAIGGWHGGMCDSFRNETEYQFMCGGQWVAHPGGIIDYSVDVVQADHEIMAGIPANFKMKSEQYYMHTDPSNNVLATTTFNGEQAAWIDGCVMPVVWTRSYGKGKVFYSSLGHNINDFDNTPEVLQIIINGLIWVMK